MNRFVIENSVFVVNFWLIFDKFHCAFYLDSKNIPYVCRTLLLRFAVDENDFRRRI